MPGNKFPGGHVSAAGGVHNAVANALAVGAESFAFFLRSQRQWKAKPLEQEAADKFKAAVKEAGFASHLMVPHGSYLLNLGSPDAEVRRKSREAFRDEIKRCQMLGIKLYNIHPGSTTNKISRADCISHIAAEINAALKATEGVTVLLENMSKQGGTIGGDLQELKDIIDKVDDKARIGVCIDTCHAMAAGYDLSTDKGYDLLKKDIGDIIGWKYLKALHLNDSKGEAGCHRDRHEKIGKGKIGLGCFRRIMNDPRFANIPMILETPSNSYAGEIELLKKMVKKK